MPIVFDDRYAFRCKRQSKRAFASACKRNNADPGVVLRALMDAYISGTISVERRTHIETKNY